MAFTGMVSTFRTVGGVVLGQNLFTIENLAGSSVVVKVRRILVQLDATAVLTAVMPQVKTFRFATPASPVGTTLTKGTFDSSQASSTLVQCRGATASDGGGATTITFTPGTVHWQQYAMRLHTAVGQVLAPDNNMLPQLIEQAGTFDFKLAAGEGLGVQVVTPTSTSNPNTNHWFVSCVWSE